MTAWQPVYLALELEVDSDCQYVYIYRCGPKVIGEMLYSERGNNSQKTPTSHL